MTVRKPCPEAPGPLEAYARGFDACFGTLAQRRAFRAYLQGLLLPRERNKTLTALAGTEPVVGAQHPAAQQLQYFLSEAAWDGAAVDARRLAGLLADPAPRPHADGVLVLDDTGDRKDGTQTAHVARQYLGSIGKVDNGIVAVTSLWADARVYSPLHVEPSTPAPRLPGGRRDPAFRTKPAIALGLVAAAQEAGVPFRAVVADSFYGDNVEFEVALHQARVPYVLGLKPSKGAWVREARRRHAGGGRPAPAVGRAGPLRGALGRLDARRAPLPRRPPGGVVGDRAPLRRLPAGGPGAAGGGHDRPGHPAPPDHLVPGTWPRTCPRPGGPARATAPFAPADLAAVVRLYGLRNWVEQGYKQVKGELGWGDFQVRTDRAIRRHWALVCCAFAFCWRVGFTTLDAPWPARPPAPRPLTAPDVPAAPPGGGENSHGRTRIRAGGRWRPSGPPGRRGRRRGPAGSGASSSGGPGSRAG